MIIVALVVLVWRMVRADETVVLEEIPTLVELLGKAAPIVARGIGLIVQFMQEQQQSDDIQALADQLNALTASWGATTQATITVLDKVASEWTRAAPHLDQVGGGIGEIGINQYRMWNRLRYVLMPNTIQYIWDWVWTNWIEPLRKGLVRTIIWDARWFSYLQVFVKDLKAWTRAMFATGRDWRMRFVYPQLIFLLHPWRVAYWYTQAFMTGISQYLNFAGHVHDRDAISRVVYSCMGRLWQSFDKHLAEWLLTDVSGYGWGASLPTFPPGADATPPRMPPGVWEPWVPEQSEPRQPPWVPDIPDVDWHY